MGPHTGFRNGLLTAVAALLPHILIASTLELHQRDWSTGTMLVQRVDKFDEFQSLQTAWDSLYRRDPESQFFLSWKWLAGVLDSYPGEWMILTARTADDILCGVLPLRRKTFWSRSRKQLRNEIEFAGRLFWADYGGILCLIEHEHEVLAALANHLKQMVWSHLYFKGFQISDRRFALFMGPFVDEDLKIEFLEAMINDGETDNLISPYIELPETFEDYLNQQLSSNTRQKARRLFRQLESSTEYRIAISSTETQFQELETLQKHWYDMWLPEKKSDTQRLAAKYSKIVKRGLDDSLVHMPVLWRGDDPLGMLVSFVDAEKSRLLFFMASRDESFDDLPVGLVLHYFSIRWAIENGLRTYDLLRGNEPYKYSLGAQDRRIKYVCVRRHSGANADGILDSGGITEAIRLIEEFISQGSFAEAKIACQQILDTQPGHESAIRILSSLDEM